jgi:DNA repair exonuclease SbcCD ATPase subunit
MNYQELKSHYDELVGQKNQIEKDLQKYKDSYTDSKRELRKYEQAKEIVKKVSIQTQQQLQYHIGDITSLALESVFEDPYKLEINFEERRNKTECDIFFVREGEKIDPLLASGGGAVDIAAFALRIASWSLQIDKSRNIIILDEPMKNISEEYKEKVSQMIKDVSKKLNIQFIIITHEPKLTNYADRVFEISKHKTISKVKTLD